MPTGAAWLAFVFLLGARVVFSLFPDAFIAYPETLRELRFYTFDQECAMRDPEPEPQIVIQGTSRLMPISFIPIGANRWHSMDKLINLSSEGNTFWHMAALLRRHPRLLQHTDLEIIDLLPLQFTVNPRFTEADALFFRESTLSEKWLVRDPGRRLKALADFVLPAWSQRHSAGNWYRALSERPRTPAERLDRIRPVQAWSFADMKEVLDQVNQFRDNPYRSRVEVASILFPKGPRSEIQVRALAELIQNAPPRGHLLLIRPPFRADVDHIVADHPAMMEGNRRLHDIAFAAEGDRIRVEWYGAAGELGLVDQDFAGDGAHFTMSGIDALQKHFVKTYRELYPR